METLFGQLEPPPVSTKAEGPFAAVALEHGIDHLLDYSIPPRLRNSLRVGQVVRVPLGRKNKTQRGYVISIHETCDYPKIKPLSAIDDERVLIPPKMMELALWMSRYYVAQLGTVLDAIVPAAVKRKIGLGYSHMVRLAQPRAKIQELIEQTKARKRRSVLARLLLLEPDHSIELNRLAGEAGTTPPTVRKLSRLGLISIHPEPDLPGLVSNIRAGGGEADRELNDEQRAVFDQLSPRLCRGFSVNLLHGVTGSGKTEIYLHCIRQIIASGKQAIVLVPEIALTPQTLQRFTARFERVAALHSGLTATERHRFWQQISTGMADVVIGAQSAVFAPMPRLGMIVVDEEHESAYKRDQAPRYNARDVAIKRGQLESVPVLLGSATPSLESYARTAHRISPSPGTPGEGWGEGSSELTSSRFRAPAARNPHAASPGVPGEGQEDQGRDAGAAAPTPTPTPAPALFALPNRVRGLELPKVELIDMKLESRMRRGVHLISQRLEALLRATIDAKHQAILLLNRRGYSNFVYCVSCQNAIQCKYCDTTMTFHRAAATHAADATAATGAHTGSLQCHYCLAVNPLPALCPVCNKKLSLFGLGTQRVEEELARKFPDVNFARVDSDSMRSSRDYEDLLGRFARGEIQVMLGTQMIAKGLDYPNVTLVGVISGDTALSLPDFRAAERTFQLITQVAGRAGRGDAPGRVIVQSFLPDDPTIQDAIKQDYLRFARRELAQRKEVGYPPFARMVRIVMRDQDDQKLLKLAEELAAEVNEAAQPEGDAIRIKGPTPCAISRIAGYHRSQLVMLSPDARVLQRVLSRVREKGALARNERIAVDVDPVSLL